MQKEGEGQRHTRGQSMVELAIALPVLLLFFIGLIEVGWALHSYLVVVNANREGARFAARGQRFYEENVDVTDRVIAERVWASLNQQVEVMMTEDDPPQLVEDGGNLTIFIHRFYIATEQPGIPTDDNLSINGGDVESTCAAAAAAAPPWSYRMGAVTNRHGDALNSQIDLEFRCLEFVQENDDFNDQIDDLYPGENIPFSVNEVVVVETLYQHEMALKTPFFTAIIPDPMPLYINTHMRVSGMRSMD